MRRLLTLTLAAAALLAVAALAGVGRPEAAHGDVASADTVTTTGHGVVTVVPDEASVSAGVHTQAVTAAAALSQNAKLMTSVIAALKAAGGSDLQTQQVSLYPQTNDQNQVTGYVADNSVSAKTKIAGAGALIDAAVAAGANNVSGPALDVSDRDALYRDALGKAVAGRPCQGRGARRRRRLRGRPGLVGHRADGGRPGAGLRGCRRCQERRHADRARHPGRHRRCDRHLPDHVMLS